MDPITGLYIGFYISGMIGGFFFGFVTHMIMAKKRAIIIKPEPEELETNKKVEE